MEQVNFEDALQQLKEVVNNLEKEDINLDDAIALYKKGIDLSKVCRDKLDGAEEMIKLVIDSNGNEENLNNDY